MLPLIPLIVLAPLAGFLWNGFLGRRSSRRTVAWIACGSVLVAFLLSVGAVVDLASGGAARYAAAPDGGPAREDLPHYEGSLEERRFEISIGTWIPAVPFVGRALSTPNGSLRVEYGFQLDPLSSVMILVVTGVGFLIHVYSTAYMAHEDGYARYFTYLNLFMAMMLVLVLANNFLLMFVGWEGVGLCSYLLIGFFTDRIFDPRTGMTCPDAGRKAFLTNRIGDFGFVIGLLFLIFYFHSVDFSDIMGAINAHSTVLYGGALMTLVGALLFFGACGKSAQIPLYVWLPDAMAGPTPVSALIHAATMVTAGVYMLARTSAIYWHAPVAMALVAAIGCATAIFAATMGLVQNDIKKVLAYSTVSQLGFMFMGAGVGAFVGSIFHLVTHAFFKACLFLGSGSVIHALGGEQDIRRMGGLRRHLPVTYGTFLVSAMAIAGIPPLAGFFSKDEILVGALANARGHVALWAVGVVAAFLTAFYMFRLVHLTFDRTFRGPEDRKVHLRESPRAMTAPLLALAGLAAAGGLIGLPKLGGLDMGLLDRWLHPTLAYHGASRAELDAARAAGGAAQVVRPAHTQDEHGSAAWRSSRSADPVEGPEGGIEAAAHLGVAGELGLMALAVVLAVAGIGLARRMYVTDPTLPERVAARAGPAYRLVAGRYYVDEIYDFALVRPFHACCGLLHWFDRWVVDGAVNGARHVTVGLSHVSSFHDRWVVDLAVNGVGALVRGASSAARRAQTGLVQNYAAVMVLGTFLLLGIYLVLR